MLFKNKDWEMGVSFSDVHVPFHDRNAVALLCKFLRDHKPNYLVINGDFMDCWDISRFDRTPRKGPLLKDEFKMAHDLLAEFRKIVPKARIVYVAGNHELRLRKYVIQNAKELHGIEGLSIQEQLHLKDLNIEYVDFPEQVTSFDHNFVKIGELFIGHFNKLAKSAGYTAKALLDDLGVSFIQGHGHKFGVSTKRLVDGTLLIGVEQGCLSQFNTFMTYPSWQLGFTVFYIKKNSKKFQLYPVNIVDGCFFFGGQEYNFEKL